MAHLLLLAITLLAAFSSLQPCVTAVVDCDSSYHSHQITRNCTPGTNSASEECCGAVVATLAAGGARCLCLTSHTDSARSAGFTTTDFQNFYDTCGGTGDYNAKFSSCADLPPPPPSTPPLPPSTPPPPPPLQVERIVEDIPWWHWILEWFLSLVTFVVVVVLLFSVVRFCTGRAGNIAAAALERMLCIPPSEARPASAPAERPTQNNGIFEKEMSATHRNMDHGDNISLIANHFVVKIANPNVIFHHYDVSIKSKDDKVVHGKSMCRRIVNKLQHSYGCQIGYKYLVYDGGKSLFTVGPLPSESLEFTVSLGKTYPRSEGSPYDVGVEQVEQEHQCFKVAINYSAKVSLAPAALALQGSESALFLEKSRQKPEEQIRAIKYARQQDRYEDDPILSSCGIKIEKQLTRLSGRVLSAPTLALGNSEVCIPNGGSWNYNNKMLLEPVKIEHWAIVNFSAHCDMSWLSKELIHLGHSKGISINHHVTLVNEDAKSRLCSPVERVEMMFKRVTEKSEKLEFLLCVLPERKNCDTYGPWKKKCLHEMGIATQCIAPCAKMNDQYFMNVLLKINAKLGGLNFKVAWKHHQMIPAVTRIPTLILGMDVSHGPAGRADLPSVAAVVGSRCWPQLTQYRASVRTQPPKAEIIHSLFTPLQGGMDGGMIRELLLEFYESSQRKPSQIIIFRDGVSESQFSQVLNVELNQIIKAYANMGWDCRPKFTVIVAQKNHHTKLLQSNSTENVPPGYLKTNTLPCPPG